MPRVRTDGCARYRHSQRRSAPLGEVHRIGTAAMTSRGRPAVESDEDALLLMAHIIVRTTHAGKRPSVRAAAREARDALGIAGYQAPEAVEDRLRRKFVGRRHELLLRVDPNFRPSRGIFRPSKDPKIMSSMSETDRSDMNAIPRDFPATEATLRRNLDDFPVFVAARKKLSSIRAELNAKSTELDKVKKVLGDMYAEMDDPVESAGAEYLATGQITQHRTSLERQRDQLEFEAEAINRAFYDQAQLVKTEKSAAMVEILQNLRPKHDELVRRIFDAATTLEQAIADEMAFRNDLATRGIETSSMPVVRDTLERSFGTRKQFGSKFNEFATAASRYLGLGEWKRGA